MVEAFEQFESTGNISKSKFEKMLLIQKQNKFNLGFMTILAVIKECNQNHKSLEALKVKYGKFHSFLEIESMK